MLARASTTDMVQFARRMLWNGDVCFTPKSRHDQTGRRHLLMPIATSRCYSLTSRTSAMARIRREVTYAKDLPATLRQATWGNCG